MLLMRKLLAVGLLLAFSVGAQVFAQDKPQTAKPTAARPANGLSVSSSTTWYLSSAPILTANWEVGSPNRWTVPFGGGVGRIMRMGAQPVNLSLRFYGNPICPEQTSPWAMRLSHRIPISEEIVSART